MSDVLISYAHEDYGAAHTLAVRLEAAGYSVWWDRSLLGGTDYEQAIGLELQTAKAVVVLWSSASTQSGWVRDEASAAMARGVLVPVLLDPSVTPPLGFRSLHTIAFSNDADLQRALMRRIGGSPPVTPQLQAARRPSGVGLVEGLCLLALVAAVATFLLLTR